MKEFPKELIEKLSSIEHDRWASWQKYIMEYSFTVVDQGEEIISLTIPKVWWEGWKRQISTPYSDLSEKEKQADRDEVMRYLPTVLEHLGINDQ